MKPAAVTFEPATSERYRPSRELGARDVPDAARASQGAESDGDGESRPDLLILGYLQALDGLRDRAAETESSAENG